MGYPEYEEPYTLGSMESKYFSKSNNWDYGPEVRETEDGQKKVVNVSKNETSYALRIPNEEREISFKSIISEYEDGTRSLSITSKNLDTLNYYTDSERDPVSFREKHEGLDLEQVVAFKNDLVGFVDDLVHSEDFVSLINESGVKFDDKSVMSILSGETTQFIVESEDDKTWRVFSEVDGAGREEFKNNEIEDSGISLD